MCIYVYMCLFVCMCVYIYIFKILRIILNLASFSSTNVIQTNTKIDEEFDLESGNHLGSSFNFSMTLKKESNDVCLRFISSRIYCH